MSNRPREQAEPSANPRVQVLTTVALLFCGLLLSSPLVGASRSKTSEANPATEKLRQRPERRPPAGASKKKAKDAKKADAEDEQEEAAPALFLEEKQEDRSYVPDIYRCMECGYEQDEPGLCPDHDETELIKVLSKGQNPLSPPEVDGNEDLIVDMPLGGLEFRLQKKSAPASGTQEPLKKKK